MAPFAKHGPRDTHCRCLPDFWIDRTVLVVLVVVMLEAWAVRWSSTIRVGLAGGEAREGRERTGRQERHACPLVWL